MCAVACGASSQAGPPRSFPDGATPTPTPPAQFAADSGPDARALTPALPPEARGVATAAADPSAPREARETARAQVTAAVAVAAGATAARGTAFAQLTATAGVAQRRAAEATQAAVTATARAILAAAPPTAPSVASGADSGRVVDPRGAGMAGVTICLAVAAYSGQPVATTNAAGEWAYTFTPDRDETLTVWPELAGYTFTPPSTAIRTYGGPRQVSARFVGQQAPTSTGPRPSTPCAVRPGQ
jgi:hypothetical protein